MSGHLPTPKCWTCAKPMTGSTPLDARFYCDHCNLHSCGSCILAHYKKAHPSVYMRETMPQVRLQNLNKSDRSSPRVKPPTRDNVIQLSKHRKAR